MAGVVSCLLVGSVLTSQNCTAVLNRINGGRVYQWCTKSLDFTKWYSYILQGITKQKPNNGTATEPTDWSSHSHLGGWESSFAPAEQLHRWGGDGHPKKLELRCNHHETHGATVVKIKMTGGAMDSEWIQRLERGRDMSSSRAVLSLVIAVPNQIHGFWAPGFVQGQIGSTNRSKKYTKNTNPHGQDDVSWNKNQDVAEALLKLDSIVLNPSHLAVPQQMNGKSCCETKRGVFGSDFCWPSFWIPPNLMFFGEDDLEGGCMVAWLHHRFWQQSQLAWSSHSQTQE